MNVKIVIGVIIFLVIFPVLVFLFNLGSILLWPFLMLWSVKWYLLGIALIVSTIARI